MWARRSNGVLPCSFDGLVAGCCSARILCGRQKRTDGGQSANGERQFLTTTQHDDAIGIDIPQSETSSFELDELARELVPTTTRTHDGG